MPATFNEIKNLRQAGDLKAAYFAAQEWLTTEPESIWAKRSLAWIFYEGLKLNNDDRNHSVLCARLDKISGLNLPDTEDIFFSQVAWSLGKYLFACDENDSATEGIAFSLFQKIQRFPFPAKEESYVFLLRSLHKTLKKHYAYRQIIDWWGLENLRPEDFKAQTNKDRQIMPFAEQIIIAYSKGLLPPNQTDMNAVKKFLPVLHDIIEKNPHFTYPAYYAAKLMLLTGDRKEAIINVLPFLRKKNKMFWVWQFLAEANPDDEELQIACFIRAINCPSPPEFLVKIRLKLASLLVAKEKYTEAKYEINKLVKIRQNAGWSISPTILGWQNAEWYRNAKLLPNNLSFYNIYYIAAENLMYQDIEPEIGVISYINSEKNNIGFLINRKKSGTFKTKHLLQPPKIGDTFLFRLQEKKGDKGIWYKVLTVEPTDNAPPSHLIKEFKGIFKTREGWNFGLVNDIFIPPNLLRENTLRNNSQISGEAILSFNKKKGVWGYSAFVIKASVNVIKNN